MQNGQVDIQVDVESPNNGKSELNSTGTLLATHREWQPNRALALEDGKSHQN